MFDMLTRNELYELHSSLALTHTRINNRLTNPLSREWQIGSAACREISETMTAVFAEIQKRQAVDA